MDLSLQNKNALHTVANFVTTPSSKSYNAIDLMKFICAILVVCIHTKPLATYNADLNFGLMHILARVAVPFFFLSAGYFFFSKIDFTSSSTISANTQYFKSYIKRLLLLYVAWSSIYLIYNGSKSDLSVIDYTLLMIKKFLLTGISYHLWYMAALIFALILVYYALKHLSFRTTLIIDCLLYSIGLLGDSYFGFIHNVPIIGFIFKQYNLLFQTTRNGLFFGFIFIVLGAYLAHHKVTLSNKKLFVLLASSFLFMTLEALTLRHLDIPKDCNMYIFLVPTTLFLFLLLLNTSLKPHPIYKVLRNLSILIYFSHILFNISYPKLFKAFGLSTIYQNSLIKFLLTMISSLLLSLLIMWLARFKPFKWLKILY